MVGSDGGGDTESVNTEYNRKRCRLYCAVCTCSIILLCIACSVHGARIAADGVHRIIERFCIGRLISVAYVSLGSRACVCV